MARPKCYCRIGYRPKVTEFRPHGSSRKKTKTIELTCEEVEALRLKDMKHMEQVDAAECMGISQSTFQRLLASAREKSSTALIQGRNLKISKQ